MQQLATRISRVSRSPVLVFKVRYRAGACTIHDISASIGNKGGKNRQSFAVQCCHWLTLTAANESSTLCQAPYSGLVAIRPAPAVISYRARYVLAFGRGIKAFLGLLAAFSHPSIIAGLFRPASTHP
jgi:hypothetical protein